MTLYALLDVPPDATGDQIREAYRILVQLHHPDRLQQVPPKVRAYAEDRLKKINQAYAVLGDPDQRARYDATLAADRARQAGRPGWDEAAMPAEWAEPEPGMARRRRRPPTAAQAAAAAAYAEWAQAEAERLARQREARRAQEAERQNREAAERTRRAAAERFPRAARQDGDVHLALAPEVWAVLRRVPAGEFVMGADPAPDGNGARPATLAPDPEAGRNEGPAHRVALLEFFIGVTPVTNAQFAAFAQATGHALPEPLPRGLADFPVVNVTWDDAAAYCRWLARLTGRPFRLPTEAEWEKAARGPDARRYPWGMDWTPGLANVWESDTPVGGPSRVGAYSPAGDSPYGLADLAGNVWEWCSDWFAARAYAPRARLRPRDPAISAPEAGTSPGYVIRGGAFDALPRQARCAYRNWAYPGERRANLGFRIVVAPF